ncbi:unnamed protein product, partial [Lampetra fluviatilis]
SIKDTDLEMIIETPSKASEHEVIDKITTIEKPISEDETANFFEPKDVDSQEVIEKTFTMPEETVSESEMLMVPEDVSTTAPYEGVSEDDEIEEVGKPSTYDDIAEIIDTQDGDFEQEAIREITEPEQPCCEDDIMPIIDSKDDISEEVSDATVTTREEDVRESEMQLVKWVKMYDNDNNNDNNDNNNYNNDNNDNKPDVNDWDYDDDNKDDDDDVNGGDGGRDDDDDDGNDDGGGSGDGND